MPITKRIVIHRGDRGSGLKNCLDYVTDKDKTEEGLLKSGINCDPYFAEMEFQAIQRKYHREDDERTAYHIIQSFALDDPITPQQAHEIAQKLCRELYGNYQCVITTHIDKGHIHNHIVVNAVNLNGRKLNDRLADKKEGLYALREASDRISFRYGCHLIKGDHPIGKYRSRDYTGKKQLGSIKKIYEESSGLWKPKIIEAIERYKETSNSLDDLLKQLALDGYEIKRGKHISVKPYGKQKFTRLYKLTDDNRYSEESLVQFFKDKAKGSYIKPLKVISYTDNKYRNGFVSLCNESYRSIVCSSADVVDGVNYPAYNNTRYKEWKRNKMLRDMLGILSTENIFTHEDLKEKISSVESDLHAREAEYEKTKNFIRILEEREPIARTYIQTYNDYLRYEKLGEQLGFENIQPSEEVQMHLNAREALNEAEIKEVREMVAEISREKRDANKQYSYISYLKSKLTDLNKIRSMSLEEYGYIKGMTFSANMIQYERSNDKVYCIKIPYTNSFIYMNKECVAWTNYGVRARMYLVDDKFYTVYNENDEKIGEIKGEDIEQYSNETKENIQEYYRSLEGHDEKEN